MITWARTEAVGERIINSWQAMMSAKFELGTINMNIFSIKLILPVVNDEAAFS